MGAHRTFFWENLPPEKLWYFVGLITSDGCLSSDGRHINVTLKEKDFLDFICKDLGLKCGVYKKLGGYVNSFAYYIQFSSRSFYDFLHDIGLTPRKSKTLGPLKIPDSGFPHFLRGLIDGDGSIRNWIHPSNKHEQWIVKIVSASEKFLTWLAFVIGKIYGLKGVVHRGYSGGCLTLKFGKLAAQELLKRCYLNADIALPRKLQKAKQCIQSERGWSKSKTVAVV